MVAGGDEVMDLSPSSFGGPGSYFRIPVQWLLSIVRVRVSGLF